MASRRRAAKPQNIVDDIGRAIVGYAQSVTGATRPRLSDNRSTARARDLTRNVLNAGVQTGDVLLSGGVAGSFYRNIAQPIGSGSRRGPDYGAFGRDAAIAAAGAAAGAAVGAVAKTGAIQRGLNAITRQKVIVHGSPMQGLGVLRPPANPSAIQSPTESGRYVFGKLAENYRFGANPASGTSVLKYTGTQTGSRRAGWGNLRGGMRDFAPGGSVYVGKTRARNITPAQRLWSDSDPSSVVVRGPVKVVSEIKVPSAPTSQQAQVAVEAQLRRALMDAGVRGTGRSASGAAAATGAVAGAAASTQTKKSNSKKGSGAKGRR